MFGIGGWELLLIFVIVLLLFGAKRLPEIARSLGKASQEFKRAKNEFTSLAEDSSEADKGRTASKDRNGAAPESPPGTAESGKEDGERT